MTEQKQNIAIAKSMGFIKANEVNECIETQCRWITPKGLPKMSIPKYTTDLNACHEFEKTLGDDDIWRYRFNLAKITGDNLAERPNRGFLSLHATAAQRCEAYLRTLNLYTDS